MESTVLQRCTMVNLAQFLLARAYLRLRLSGREHLSIHRPGVIHSSQIPKDAAPPRDNWISPASRASMSTVHHGTEEEAACTK